MLPDTSGTMATVAFVIAVLLTPPGRSAVIVLLVGLALLWLAKWLLFGMLWLVTLPVRAFNWLVGWVAEGGLG